MQPPSFEDFMRKGDASASPEEINQFKLAKCPTPGCRSGTLYPRFEDGILVGFSCEFGCKYTAKRNAFTGDITYFKLDSFIESQFKDPLSLKGLKINPLGEIYTDWY